MALGLICLAATLGADGLRRRGLGLHAHLQAAALTTLVVTHAAGANTAEYITAAAAGLLIGPSLAFRVGQALAHDPQQVGSLPSRRTRVRIRLPIGGRY